MPEIVGPVFTDIEDYGVQINTGGDSFSLSVSENLYENERVDKETLGGIIESEAITKVRANDEGANQEEYDFNISDDMIEEFDAPTNSITYYYKNGSNYLESYYSYYIGNKKDAYYYPRRYYYYAYSSYSDSDVLYFPNPIKSSLENAKEYKILEVIEKDTAVDGRFGKVLIGPNQYAYAGVGGAMADYIDSISYINFASYIGDSNFQKYSSLWYAFRNGNTVLSAEAFWTLYNNKVSSCNQILTKSNFTNKIYCDTFHKRNFYGGFLAKDIVIKNNSGSALFYKTPYYGGMKVDASGDGVITINSGTTTFKAGKVISGFYDVLLTAIMSSIEGHNISVNGLSGSALADFKISAVSTSYGLLGGDSNIENEQTGYISAIGGDPFWSPYWGPFRCRGYLKEVHIPEGYHYIGPGAFYHTNIERLYLPKVNKKNNQGSWQASLRIEERACIDNYYLEDVYINNNHTDFTTSAPLSLFFTPRNGTVHFLDGSITYKNGSSQGFKTTGAYQFVNKT